MIFAKTYEEYRFAERLQSNLDASQYMVFVPTKDRSFRLRGAFNLHRVILFPGYVFVAALAPAEDCLRVLKEQVRRDAAALKLLGIDGECGRVSEQDKSLLIALLDEEFNIPAVDIAMVGDEVVITGGPFEAQRGRVRKANKYRQTVDVEFELLGRTVVETFAARVLSV